MKCGIEDAGEYDRYPDNLPIPNAGIEIFNIGKFGEIPKEREISGNKDDQVDTI